MSKLVNNNGYKKLVFCITDILEFGRKKVYLQVNDVLAKTYWNVGKQIVEYEQKGYKKAEYGFGVLKNLSKDLTQKFGRGFSVDNLE
ncbi:MAG: hypothetical protein HOG08_03260, partial [Candidatus Magasanikbacteria bacterium]|nr:hypothetical protein [Candidatus Magasanikbacteria bacterium]